MHTRSKLELLRDMSLVSHALEESIKACDLRAAKSDAAQLFSLIKQLEEVLKNAQ